MPYYREDLDPSRCSLPGCDRSQHENEIYFSSQCHFGQPMWVRYRGDVLTVECSVCKKVVVAVVIASRADEERHLEEDAPPRGHDDEERCP